MVKSVQEWLDEGGGQPKPEKRKPLWQFWVECLIIVALVLGIGYFGIAIVTWLAHLITPEVFK